MLLKVTFAIVKEPGGEKEPRKLTHGNVFHPRMPELLSHSRLPSTSPRESTFDHARNVRINGGQFNIAINHNRGPLPSCALSIPLMYSP
jgi:hypothetical protein